MVPTMATVVAIVFILCSTRTFALDDDAVLDFESQFEDEDIPSVCLLQKELRGSVSKQLPKDDGPYLSTDGLAEWEKDFIDNSEHGPSYTSTIQSTDAQHPVKETRHAPELGASPLDSLDAQAPVPAPAADKDYQDWWHSITWSSALFGMIVLWIAWFLLLDFQSHKGCQMTVQTALSNVAAFFIARLLFAAISLMTAAVMRDEGYKNAVFEEKLSQDADWQILTVSICRAAIIYVCIQGMMWVICSGDHYHETVVMCISNVGAPLIGFAMIDVCGTRLRFSDVNHGDLKLYLCVAVLISISLGILLSIDAIVQKYRLRRAAEHVRGASQEHVAQDNIDLENTMFAMATGFLIYKVAERIILGEQAFARGPVGEESWDETLKLLAVIVLLMACAFVVWNLRNKYWAQSRGALVDGSAMPMPWQSLEVSARILDWMEGSCFMSIAYCSFGALSWIFSNSSFKGLLQSGFTSTPLIVAFVATAAVVLLGFTVGLFIGSGGPSILHHHGGPDRFSHWLLLSGIGFFGSLAWSTCYIHAARDLASNFAYKYLAEGLFLLALALFIMPAWVLLSLPPRKRTADDVTAYTNHMRRGNAQLLMRPP
jgi:hypothetical protein